MAQGKQEPNFERNPGIRFIDNCDTDGRTDKFLFHELCWHSQAVLKIIIKNVALVDQLVSLAGII